MEEGGGEKVESSADEERLRCCRGAEIQSLAILILWNASAPLTYLRKVKTRPVAHEHAPPGDDARVIGAAFFFFCPPQKKVCFVCLV